MVTQGVNRTQLRPIEERFFSHPGLVLLRSVANLRPLQLGTVMQTDTLLTGTLQSIELYLYLNDRWTTPKNFATTATDDLLSE